MLSGVPHFVVKVSRRPGATADGDEEGMVRTVVPGAQDTEVFRFALMKLLARAGYGESGAVAAHMLRLPRRWPTAAAGRS